MTDVEGRERIIDLGPAPPRLVRAKTSRKLLQPRPNATVVVAPAGSPTPTDNDYTRILNAVTAAVAGETIDLQGTFNWTEPNAKASWLLGNNGIAGDADDHYLVMPAGVNNVTITSTTSATIQGPGDLATLDQEGAFLFDGGPNQNWTISNLSIFDFDLAIGMFVGGAATGNDFLGTTITGNHIRVPPDLEDVGFPIDVFQNIGLHFSFGPNQTVSNNIIDIDGSATNGTSGGFAADVGMQSNTSGPSGAYAGLLITGNTVNITNAQDPNPERILGIWENSGDSQANITASNNTFKNLSGSNNSGANGQRAFRIRTSSGVSTTVQYVDNSIGGANIGFEWINGVDLFGINPILLTGNTISNCGTGALIRSDGEATFYRNVITGGGTGPGISLLTGRILASGPATVGIQENVISGGAGDGVSVDAGATSVDGVLNNDLSGNAGFGLNFGLAGPLTAERNYFGNNLQASVAAEVGGNVDFDPWLASPTDTVPGTKGFQPFSFATTSGTLTTFAGTAAGDTMSVTSGSPHTLTINGISGTVASAQLLTLHVDGGAAADSLAGPATNQTWTINTANAGTTSGIITSFAAIETLIGNSSNDTFAFQAGSSVSGSIDGGLGFDTLDFTLAGPVTVNLLGPGTLDGQRGTASLIGGTFDNINAIPNGANLAVSKSSSGSTTVGSNITYTIVVTNNGTAAAANVTMTDPLPPQTVFFSLSAPAGWTCSTPAFGANGTVTCTNPSFAPGTATFTLIVRTISTGVNVTNTATVSSINDVTPADNAASTSVSIAAVPEPIPTLSQWMLFVLVFSLVIAGLARRDGM